MKRLICALLLVVLLIPAAAFAEEKPSILGDFETTDLYGNAVTSEVVSSATLTFVNVWATFCNTCIVEMPLLAELATEYEGRVQFMGIVSDINSGYGLDESAQELAVEIIEQLGATSFSHIVPTDYLNTRILFSISTVPTHFLVDSAGRQVGKARGYFRSADEIRTYINDAIASLEA